jgi:hypothetical protein
VYRWSLPPSFRYQLMESLKELNASDAARAGRPRGMEERRQRLVEESRALAATAATCGLSDDKRVIELAREDAAVAAVQAAGLELRRGPHASLAASACRTGGAPSDVTVATLLQLRTLVLGDRKFEYKPGGEVFVRDMVGHTRFGGAANTGLCCRFAADWQGVGWGGVGGGAGSVMASAP